MRKILLGLVTVATVAVPVTLAAAPANAASNGDHRACVTAGEWSQIHARMAKGTVSRILDGPGTLWWTSNLGNDQYRTYRPCASFGNNQPLVVWYDNYSYGSSFRVWDKYRSTNHDMPNS